MFITRTADSALAEAAAADESRRSSGRRRGALDGIPIGVKDILRLRRRPLLGVLTNACVLLTATAGFDLGYQGYVVRDATATLNDDMQRSAEDVLGYFIASVVNTDDAIALLAPE